nr:hypothetical protein [Tanacetum cinerariifolium]
KDIQALHFLQKSVDLQRGTYGGSKGRYGAVAGRGMGEKRYLLVMMTSITNGELFHDVPRLVSLSLVIYCKSKNQAEPSLAVEAEPKEEAKATKANIVPSGVAVAEILVRTVPVETPASSALVSCDGLGGYDLSDQLKEGNFMPLKPDLFGLEDFVNEPIVKKPIVETSEAKACVDKPKVVRKKFGSPLIED